MSHESTVGVTDKSVFWGTYISKLDNTLRRLLNDLAVSRAKRKGLEKAEQLMVNIEDLLQSLTNRTIQKERTTKRPLRLVLEPRRRILMKKLTLPTPVSNIYHDLLVEWRMQKQTLLKRLAPKRK